MHENHLSLLLVIKGVYLSGHMYDAWKAQPEITTQFCCLIYDLTGYLLNAVKV